MRKTILISLNLFISLTIFGQSSKSIKIPAFDDKYSEFVKQLENGQTNIDFKTFRESFIESEQFKIASRNKTVYDSLKKTMYTEMEKRNHSEIINITSQMLSIDYTSMIAHKILRQTYQLIGDTVNSTKYKTIQFGLLNSIVKNGDGKTCETAWPVIQIEEEYFILQMLDARLNKQRIDGICDKIDATVEGERKQYYFEISSVIKGYKQLSLQ